MTNAALQYAEVELGVHEVYLEAMKAHTDLIHVSTMIVNHRNEIREIEAAIATREAEIVDEEWGKHPDMAVTRMDKHVKTAILKDPTLIDQHRELRSRKFDLDVEEANKSMLEGTLRMNTARMNELGGYLQYLAAVKQAQRVRANPE